MTWVQGDQPVSEHRRRGQPLQVQVDAGAAGYPNGLTLTLAYANNPPMPEQAAALQSDFPRGRDAQARRAAVPR